MLKPLIIVESPTKVKTLKKFLGKKYTIASSVGHVRDLPEKSFGIDMDNAFAPTYEVLPNKKKVVQELQKLAQEASVIYLAPDPDREGEAIAWHIASLLPKKSKIHRTTFYAITPDAVREALAHPRAIDMDLVNAQQARRLLDRIVGYKLSPIVARKLQSKKGTSAGRVQSAALKLVVDREKEIQKFQPVEYWNLSVILHQQEASELFTARVYSYKNKLWDKEKNDETHFTIPDEIHASAIEEKLKKASFSVKKIQTKEKTRNPEPPFITSTLQQEASRHFRYSSSKTMQIAQSLYEGVDLKDQGTEGLITYMRTDSTRIAPEALHSIRSCIEQHYGKEFIPEKPRFFKQRKSAQDAHEAIRPTNFNHPPELLKPYLTQDQWNLYSLIWHRCLASQMKSALYHTVSVDIITNQQIMLRATGSTLLFKGFTILYEEKRDEDDEQTMILPLLTQGEKLSLDHVKSEQAFTRPPPRFTEALLVKELEKSGIGRPSTYATIMNKIQSRAYTYKENHRLKPTELGIVITEFLEANFADLMDISFTSQMEDRLELIAQHKEDWQTLLAHFWNYFGPHVEKATKEAFVPKVMTETLCSLCEAPLQKIWSKGKYFYGCSRYPECQFTASKQELTFSKDDYAADFRWDQPCPLCGAEMMIRHGRFGPFLGCTQYPSCKGIINIPKKGEHIPPQEDINCPAIGCDGKILLRKSRMGRLFYSCSNFPDCDVIVNQPDELSSKYIDHVKTPYQKPNKQNNQIVYTLSEPLSQVCGFNEGTRSTVIKQVWNYIKEHNLQDPQNRRKIVPDSLLAKLFGQDEPIDMFQLPRILANNLKK